MNVWVAVVMTKILVAQCQVLINGMPALCIHEKMS